MDDEEYKDPQAESHHLMPVLFDLVGKAMPYAPPATIVTTAVGLGYMVTNGMLRWHQVVELLVP